MAAAISWRPACRPEWPGKQPPSGSVRTPQAAGKVFRDLMRASTGTRRAVQNGMFTFACPSPAAWFPAALDYTLAGVS